MADTLLEYTPEELMAVVISRERLPPGDSELYSQPSLTESRSEFEALISPRVRQQAERAGIEFIRYEDL